jgi:hypothetical protein
MKVESTTITPPKTRRQNALVAVSGADGNAMAALGPTTGQHGCAALGLHTDPEAVGLGPVTAVGLKCALRHGSALLLVTLLG